MFGHQNTSVDVTDANNSDSPAFPPVELLDDQANPAASPAVGAPGSSDIPVPLPDPIAPAPPAPTEPTTVEPTALPLLTATSSTDDLLAIKQTALQQLTPLVGHLDQAPEEKFRTTMMMIQASDDHSLINSAYEAAQQIADEKVKAQALLDVVNEINYFTQHQS